MLTRRGAMSLAAASTLGAMVSRQARAEASWRLASKMPPDSPEGKVFQYFADKAKEYSNGALQVNVFPNEQLGKEEAVLEQLKIGTVNLYAEGSVFMQKWVPAIRWNSAPFLFKDRDHWVRFINTPLVQGWYNQAREQAGIGILGDLTAILRGPYRVILTKDPLKGLPDVKGIKLRMANDKTGVEVWRYLGAEVRVLGWTDTYELIQRGIVNAVTSPIALVESMKFYEVAPYITRTNEYWQSIAFMMNQKGFDALSPELQQALLKAHQDAAKYSVDMMGNVAQASLKRMEGKGAHYAEIDLAPFQEKMRGFYEEKQKKGELPDGFLAAVKATAKPT